MSTQSSNLWAHIFSVLGKHSASLSYGDGKPIAPWTHKLGRGVCATFTIFYFLFVVHLFWSSSRAMVYTIVLATESQENEDILTPIWTHEVPTRKEGKQLCRILRRLFWTLGYRANFFHLSVERGWLVCARLLFQPASVVSNHKESVEEKEKKEYERQLRMCMCVLVIQLLLQTKAFRNPKHMFITIIF